LPNTGAPGGSEVAERLRQAVERYSFEHGRVTCSIGVATGTVACLEETREAADKALYQAKQGGRNRVVAAGGEANKLHA
jgi:diguanylate cyclase (GGDEF)-like protein